MLPKNNDTIYTASDIEKYHSGLMSSKERHALEKAALDDPFLADALEGYATPSINSSDDINELKKRLAARIEQDKEKPLAPALRSSFTWWKAAAMIILVFGAGLLVYQFGFNKKQSEIAQTNKQVPVNTETTTQNLAKADSLASPVPDSDSTNAAIEQPQKDLDLKNIEPSSTLVSTDSKTKNISAESNAVRNDFAKGLADTIIPGTTTAQAKTDHTANETKKSLRNDNAFDKNGITEKNKAKEPTLKQKVDSDPVPAVVEGYAASKPVAGNARRSPQDDVQYKTTNIFRGRVTDANNNPIPFSNITNPQDNIGTYSDARGYFNLTAPDSILNVQVRSLGFESNNVQLLNKVPENKVLLEEDRSLGARVLDTVKRNANRSRNNNMVLEEPEPVDGWSNYDMYLVNNLKVPESFRSKQSGAGEVELSFEVDKNGGPVNITVKKSLCDSCDKEAIRLIKEGPKWKRKIKKGKATVTVAF